MTRRLLAYLVVAAMLLGAVSWSAARPLWAQEDEPTEDEARQTEEARAEVEEERGDADEPTGSPVTESTPSVVPPTSTAYPLRALSFYLLAQTDVRVAASGPVVVSAATIVLQPGIATTAFTTEGETVIAASIGEVVIDADQGVVTTADIGSAIGLEVVAGTPGPLATVNLGPGMQAHLPSGATVSLRNDSVAGTTVMILTVVPAA